jgi:hypothetical protein
MPAESVLIFANETCPDLELDVQLLVGRFSWLPVWLVEWWGGGGGGGRIVLHKQKAPFDYNTFILDFIGISLFLFVHPIFAGRIGFFLPQIQ